MLYHEYAQAFWVECSTFSKKEIEKKNLIHSGISEQQSRIVVRDNRGGVDIGVALLRAEIVDERRANLVTRHELHLERLLNEQIEKLEAKGWKIPKSARRRKVNWGN